MPSMLRRLLLVLLMLALPLQGVAATAMRLCEAMHDSGVAAGTVPDVQAGRPASAIAGDAAPRQAAHDCDHALADAVADVDGDDAAAFAPGSCSVCAACCLTAMPVAAALDVGHPTLAGVQAGVTAAPVAGPAPDRLERPPRAV